MSGGGDPNTTIVRAFLGLLTEAVRRMPPGGVPPFAGIIVLALVVIVIAIAMPAKAPLLILVVLVSIIALVIVAIQAPRKSGRDFLVILAIMSLAIIAILGVPTHVPPPPPAPTVPDSVNLARERDVHRWAHDLDSLYHEVDGRDFWPVVMGDGVAPPWSPTPYRTSLSLTARDECTLTRFSVTRPQVYECRTTNPAPFTSIEEKFRAYVDAEKTVVPPNWIRHEDSVSFTAINSICSAETTLLKINSFARPELLLRIEFPRLSCPLIRPAQRP